MMEEKRRWRGIEADRGSGLSEESQKVRLRDQKTPAENQPLENSGRAGATPQGSSSAVVLLPSGRRVGPTLPGNARTEADPGGEQWRPGAGASGRTCCRQKKLWGCRHRYRYFVAATVEPTWNRVDRQFATRQFMENTEGGNGFNSVVAASRCVYRMVRVRRGGCMCEQNPPKSVTLHHRCHPSRKGIQESR